MTDNARIFETEDQARGAIDKLIANGFDRSDTLLLTPSGDNAAAVKAAIADGFMPSAYLRSISSSLDGGRSVVAITPPFGSAQMATELLDSCDPVDSEKIPQHSYTNATPLSDFLGIPVLSNVKSTTTLSTGWSLSSKIGMKMLSKNPTPLSSLVNMKTLTDNKSKSSSFGLPLLSSKATPLSSMIGFKPLTKRQSKDSSFGFRLLSKSPTPLSSMFGLRTLSRKP